MLREQGICISQKKKKVDADLFESRFGFHGQVQRLSFHRVVEPLQFEARGFASFVMQPAIVAGRRQLGTIENKPSVRCRIASDRMPFTVLSETGDCERTADYVSLFCGSVMYFEILSDPCQLCFLRARLQVHYLQHYICD